VSLFQSLSTVRKYIWRYRWGMALGGVCLVLKDLAQAAQPLMIRGAVDALAGRGALFLRFAAYLVGLALLKGLFQYWMRVIIIGISRDIEYDLRNDLFRRLADLSPDYYARTRTGDIMARATNDLNAVRMMLGPGVMYCFETGLTFVLAIAIMVSVDWRLALPALLPAPAVSVAVAESLLLLSSRSIFSCSGVTGGFGSNLSNTNAAGLRSLAGSGSIGRWWPVTAISTVTISL